MLIRDHGESTNHAPASIEGEGKRLAIAGASDGSRAELANKVAAIRGEIADVLLEIDDINLQINPQILADYTVKIGCWENELLRAQITARRARRKCELAQAAANRRELVDEAVCEGILKAEFAQWEEDLALQVARLKEAMERRAAFAPLSPADSKELKSLHRKLVKRLHPDMHPEQDEEARSFFALAQRAFELGDVHMLRAVDAATQALENSGSNEESSSQTEEDLLLEISLLEVQLSVYKKQLAALKANNPYALGKLLTNDDWVENTVAALKASIAEQNEIALTYERRFKAVCEEAKNHAA